MAKEFTIKFYQGEEANRLSISPVPASGEPIWITDEKKLYVGDGSTAGGILVSGGAGATDLNSLSDVILTSPSGGQGLIYNGSQWINDDIVANAVTGYKYSGTITTAPTGTGEDTIVIGEGANGGISNDAVVIGSGASASVNNAIAIGKDSSADGGFNAIAIGNAATTTTTSNAIAIGAAAQADAGHAMALGNSASATNSGAIAFGRSTTAGSDDSVAIGRSAVAPTNGLEIRVNNSSSATLKMSSSGAVTFADAYTFPTSDGTINQVLVTDGSGNLTFGSSIGNLDGLSDVIITSPSINEVLQYNGSQWVNAAAAGGFPTGYFYSGTITTAPTGSGSDTIVIGEGANANTSDNSVIIGTGATVGGSDDSCVVIGPSSTSNGDHAIAIGDNANASASTGQAIAIGYNTVANGVRGIAIGSNTSASGQNSVAIGADSSTAATASDLRAIAIGASCNAGNTGSVAIGYNNTSSADYAIAIGASITNSTTDTVRIGVGSTNYMDLNATGQLSLSGTNAAFMVPTYTTTERNALSVSAGAHVFDTDLGSNGLPIWYDGTNWIDAAGNTV